MNDKAEEMRAKMKALTFPDDALSNASSPTGSWSARSARPKPSLNVTGPFTSGGGRRPLPNSLALTPSPGGDRLRIAVGNEEQERKLKEIMSQTGLLQINGKQYSTKIDDLELIGDLGNGTCGHVVEMRHKESNSVIAVKQMRRTGNSDENKRILMDLDVVLKSHDCEQIVLCLGCFITDSDVWICMELMATCFDKLLKQLKQPIPEAICGKVAVATLKALNYLKENHGVIHRDVKPSNILLDANGRVKLCDFGISGRLVDSKAKTRSAGCAAYMAPERIDPPNPSKPDYDIRADVWSLGITLVELATGHFPYRDCKTDFEVLTKVLQDNPPLLPRNGGFSVEFRSFVQDCLMKNYKDRPKYKKLLLHPFVSKYEREEVDVGAWYRSHLKNFNNALTTTPNNNQIAYDPLPSTNALDRSFKPQPSPRVVRARRQTSQPSPAPAYPSAIAERDRRPSFEVLLENRRVSSSAGHEYPQSRDATVTSKPPPAIPSPSDPVRSFSTSKHLMHGSASLSDGSMLGRSQGSVPSQSSTSPTSRVYERWHPTNGGLNYSGAASTSSHISTPSRSGYVSGGGSVTGADSDASKNYNSMHYQSPRLANKFEFTYPSTSYVAGGASSSTSSSPHHRHLNYSSTPTAVRRTTSTEHQYLPHALPHHVAYQQHHFASPSSGVGAMRTSPTTSSGATSLPITSETGRPSRERLSRLDASGPPVAASDASAHLLASPPSPSRERQSYFPSSWRSTLSSWTTSWQSPLSLRRLRTASSDRSSGFDSTRRFQPSYRSWNEKDNYYSAMKR